MAKRVLVIDGDDQGHFFLSVDGGIMKIGDSPAHAEAVLRDLHRARVSGGGCRGLQQRAIRVAPSERNNRGRHDGCLIAIFHGDHNCLESNNCFSASHIALHQSIHRIGRRQILDDFF